MFDSKNKTCSHSRRYLIWDDTENKRSFSLATGNERVVEETSSLLENGEHSLLHCDDSSNKGRDCFATVSASNSSVEGFYGFEQPSIEVSTGIYCFWKELCILISNKLWICSCLTLSFLFFTIEGIRYWVVLYRQEVYSDTLSNIIFVFVIVSVTAPITGVLVGGCLIDILGGYKNPEALSRTLKVVCLFGLLGFIAAWFCVLKSLSNLIYFGISLWLIIFFGAAMVAPLTGIMVSVVPYEHRSISSAMSLLISHVFGYFAAPLVTGSISQIYGIRIGFPCILLFGSSSLLFILFALVYNQKQMQTTFHRNESNQSSFAESSSESLTMYT